MYDTKKVNSTLRKRIGIFSGTELQEAQKCVAKGERITALLHGWLNGKSAVLALAADRLIFVRKANWTTEIQCFMFETIESVTYSEQQLIATMKVFVNGTSLTFISANVTEVLRVGSVLGIYLGVPERPSLYTENTALSRQFARSLPSSIRTYRRWQLARAA